MKHSKFPNPLYVFGGICGLVFLVVFYRFATCANCCQPLGTDTDAWRFGVENEVALCPGMRLGLHSGGAPSVNIPREQNLRTHYFYNRTCNDIFKHEVVDFDVYTCRTGRYRHSNGTLTGMGGSQPLWQWLIAVKDDLEGPVNMQVRIFR